VFNYQLFNFSHTKTQFNFKYVKFHVNTALIGQFSDCGNYRTLHVSMKQSIGLSGLSVWVICIRRQIADSAGPGGSGSSLQCIKCSVACYITFIGLPHFIENNLEHQGDTRHPLFNCKHSAGRAKCLPMGKKRTEREREREFKHQLHYGQQYILQSTIHQHNI